MASDEYLRGIIEIETLLGELDQLLWKLGQVQTAIEAVDGQTVRVDVETRGFEQALAELGVLRGGAIGGGDIADVGGDRDGGGGRGIRSIARLGAAPLGALDDMEADLLSFTKGIDDANRSIEAIAESSTGLLDRFQGVDIRMTDLHNALARLVPMLLTIIGALPALIAGLVGLAGAALAAAAALFGIAGFGALGFAMQQDGNIMEGFTEILQEIRDDFLDAFTPLANQLAQLFEDALSGLDAFFQALADNGDALLMFEQTARDFGGFLLDTLPDAIAFLAQVARAFAPLFGMLADFLSDGNIGAGFMEFMADVTPALTTFVGLLAAMLPDLLRMSIGFLQVTNIIMAVVNVFFALLDVLGISDQMFGFLVASVLAAYGALLLFNSAIVKSLLGSLAALGTRVLALISTYTSYSASSVIATLASYGFAKALLTVIGVATLGIGAMVALGATTAAVGDKFSQLTGGVNEASSAIRNFDKTTSNMSEARVSAYSPQAPPSGMGRGSGGGDTRVRIDGDANKDTVETQVRNANFRSNRTGTGAGNSS